jgi:hypothetical protein
LRKMWVRSVDQYLFNISAAKTRASLVSTTFSFLSLSVWFFFIDELLFYYNNSRIIILL